MRFLSSLTAIVLMAALTAACSTSEGPPGLGMGAWFDEEWTFERTESHVALADGVELAIWARGSGSSKERTVAVRKGGLDYATPTMTELFKYAHPIESGRAATAYADLALRVLPTNSGLTGEPLVLAGASGREFGDSGTFTYADARAWGIEPVTYAQRHAGGYKLTQIVYLPPAQHPEILSKIAPARVVERTLVVYPDGVLEPFAVRTLTNGEDAARFATY